MGGDLVVLRARDLDSRVAVVAVAPPMCGKGEPAWLIVSLWLVAAVELGRRMAALPVALAEG